MWRVSREVEGDDDEEERVTANGYGQLRMTAFAVRVLGLIDVNLYNNLAVRIPSREWPL